MTINISASSFENFQTFGSSQVITKKEHPFLTATLPYQLPAFIREDYPKFVAFLQAYYEWMEQKGGIVSDTKRIITNQDIDSTDLDEYFEFFRKEFLVNISANLKSEENLVLKNIRDYYRARGTEKSFQFFFRILLGQEAKFYYPRVDMLKVSDGKWIQNKTIRVSPLLGDPFSFIGKKIRGLSSNASAYVESVIQIQEGPYTVYELYLNSSSISGIFSSSENIKDEVDPSICARISPIPVSVTVTTKGSGYQDGQVVNITGAGYGAVAKVTSVNEEGGIEKISISNFGAEYNDIIVTIPAPLSGEQAYATANIGAVAQYPGFYLNEDGQLSTTKYLQDSYYYQQFSYVVIVEEALAAYKDVLKKSLHPAGLILFATALSENTVDAGPSIGVGQESNQSLVKRTIQQFSNPTIDGQQLSLDGERHPTNEVSYEEQVIGNLDGLVGWFDGNVGVQITTEKVANWSSKTSGNHVATQASSGSRPILSREDNKENRLRYSEQLNQGEWVKVRSAVGATNTTATLDPWGGNVAEKLVDSVDASTTHKVYQQFFGIPSQQYIATIFVKAAEITLVNISITSSNETARGGAMFNLLTGAVTSPLGTGHSMENVGNGWWKCTVTATLNAADLGGALFVYLGKPGEILNYTGNGTDGIYLTGGQVRSAGSDPTYIQTLAQAQRMSLNGNRTLTFDGTDDYLSANSLASSFTGEDKPISIFTVTRSRFTDAVSRSILMFGNSGSTAQYIDLRGTTSAAVNSTTFIRQDNTGTGKDNVGISAISSFRIISAVDTGTVNNLFVDGVQIATVNDDVNVGTLSLDKFSIGARSRVSNDQFWDGEIAEILIFNRAVSSEERRLVESYLKKKFFGIQNLTIDSNVNKKLQTIAVETKPVPAYEDFDISEVDNLITWIDPNESVSLVSGAISQLNDLTGNGNNALQTVTTSARPILSRKDNKENLITNSETFASGSKLVVTDTGLTPPEGHTKVQLLTEDNTSGTHFTAYKSSFLYKIGGTYAMSAFFKANTGTRWAAWSDGSGAYAMINPITGETAIINSTAKVSDISSTNIGDGWWKLDWVVTNVAANGHYILMSQDSVVVTYLGDPSNSVYFSGMSVRSVDADDDYVFIPASATYPELAAVNENRIAAFDGINDHFDSNLLVNTSKGVTGICFIRSDILSSGVSQTICAARTGISSDRMMVYINNGEILCRFYNGSDDNIGRRTAPYTINVNEKAVVSFTYDGSNTSAGIKIYKNGNRVDTTDFNFGTYTTAQTDGASLVIGATNTGSSNLFSGYIGSFIFAQNGQISDSQRVRIEKLLMNKYGVQTLLGNPTAFWDPDANTSTENGAVLLLNDTVNFNNAGQLTTNLRPFLTGASDQENRIRWSKDLSKTSWVYAASSHGGNNKLVENSSLGTHYVINDTYVHYANRQYTFGVRVTPAGRTWFRLYILGSTASPRVYFNATGSGVIGTVSGSALNSRITKNLDGSYTAEFDYTYSVDQTTNSFRVYLASGDIGDTYQGDGTSGIIIHEAYARLSSKEYLTEATTSFPVFAGLNNNKLIFFDGGNDYLTTNLAVNPSGGMWFSSIIKVDTSTQMTLCSAYLSDVNIGRRLSVLFNRYSPGRIEIGIYDGAGGFIGRNTPVVFSTNQTFVFSWSYDGGTSATSIKIYINGIQVDTASISGGSYFVPVAGNNFEIGSDRGGTSNRWNGHIGSVIFKQGGTISDTDRRILETYLMNRYLYGVQEQLPLTSGSEDTGQNKVSVVRNWNRSFGAGTTLKAIERSKFGYTTDKSYDVDITKEEEVYPADNRTALNVSLSAYYDTSDSQKSTLIDGAVSQITDSSGYSFVASQATPANRPLLTRSDNKENRLSYNESFQNSVWTKQDTSVIDNIEPNPIDNLVTASKLTTSGGVTGHYVYQTPFLSSYTGIRYRSSVYAKIGSANTTLQISWQNACQVTFDLAGGNPTIDFDGGSVTASQVSVGGGWYKCTLEVTPGTGGGIWRLYIKQNNNISFDGATGAYIFLYGPQFQLASCDSDYLPTTTFPILSGTNGNSTICLDGAGDHLTTSLACAPAGGICIAAFVKPNVNNTSQMIVSAWTGASNNRLAFFLDSGGNIEARIYNNSTDRIGRIGATYSAGEAFVISMTYDGSASASGIKLYKNGVQIDTANSNVGTYAVPAAGNNIQIGTWNSGLSGANFNGLISEPIYVQGKLWSDKERQVVENYLIKKYLFHQDYINVSTYNEINSPNELPIPYVLPTFGATALWSANKLVIVDKSKYVDSRSAFILSDLTGNGNHASQGSSGLRPLLSRSDNKENLVLYSEQLDNAAWTKSASTVTANSTIAPDGTLTADKMIETATTAAHRVISSGYTLINGVNYVGSAYFKSSERTIGYVRVNNVSTDASCYFNLSTASTSNATNCTATIEDVGNGWYRCSIYFTSLATAVSQLYLNVVTSIPTISYAGDGVSGIFVWGGQCRLASTDSTYVPTTSYQQISGINGNSVVIFDGSNDRLNTLISVNPTGGLAGGVAFRATALDVGFSIAFARTSTATDRFFVQVDTNGSIACRLYSSSVDYIGRTAPASTIAAGTPSVITWTYDGTTSATGIKIYKNGVQVDTATVSSGAYSVPGAGTTLVIGNNPLGTAANGAIGELIFVNAGIWNDADRQAWEKEQIKKYIIDNKIEVRDSYIDLDYNKSEGSYQIKDFKKFKISDFIETPTKKTQITIEPNVAISDYDPVIEAAEGLKLYVNPEKRSVVSFKNEIGFVNDLSVNKNDAFQGDAAKRPILCRGDNKENRFLYSEEFDNAYWSKTAITVTANQVTSPLGETEFKADKIAETATTNNHELFKTGIPVITSSAYTFSIYAKAAERQYIQLYGTSAHFGVQDWAIFDLIGGTITQQGTSGTAKIENVGNGWYRCSRTLPVSAAGDAQFYYAICTSGTQGRGPSYAGTLNNGLYVWGAQVSSDSADSIYIKTTTYPFYAGIKSSTDNKENLLTHSEDITSEVSWLGGTRIVKVGSNIITSGDTNLIYFREDASASNTHYLQRSTSATLKVVSGTQYRIRFLAKSTNRWISLRTTTGFTSSYCTFNLQTGVIEELGAGYSNASAIDIGSGVRECKVDITASSTTDFAIIAFYLYNASRTYTGDGVSGAHIGGIQVRSLMSDDVYVKTIGYPKYRHPQAKDSRENFLTYSEKFSDNTWLKNNISIIRRHRLVEGEGITQPEITKYFDDLPVNKQITFGCRIKPNGRDFVKLTFSGIGNTTGSVVNVTPAAFFNLTGNGSVGTVSGGALNSRISKNLDDSYTCEFDYTVTAEQNIQKLFKLSIHKQEASGYAFDGISGAFLYETYVRKTSASSSYVRTLDFIKTEGEKYNRVALLDGTDDNFITSYSLNQSSGLSGSILIRPNSLGIHVIMASYSSITANRRLQFYIESSGNLKIALYDSNGTAYIGRGTNSGTIAVNESAVFTWTYDGGLLSSGIKIYKNGVQVDTSNFESGVYTVPSIAGDKFLIGSQDPTVTPYYFKGYIGPTAIWNRKLTDAEIQKITNNWLTRFGIA